MEKVDEPMYFVEQAGVGFDADHRYYWTQFIEKGKISPLVHFASALLSLGPPAETDGKVVERKRGWF